ncbi:MAG TPA: hypothetical protein PLQ19_04740 [Aeromicrobium sp.]|mgnify:CR=1 FL=1|nr:hypothetical protein [Aeromicrobium sp.]
MNEPLEFKTLDREIGKRDRLAEPPESGISTTLFLPGAEPVPQVSEVSVVEPGVRLGQRDTFRIDLDLPRRELGVHAVPPGLAGTKLSKRRKLLREEDAPAEVGGFLPDHLARRVRPEKLDRKFARRLKTVEPTEDDPRIPTTIFGNDDRYWFNDTAFPWCTTGRVETSNGGWASGAMIGPRHLLTCSHAIGWNTRPDPYVAGWIKFMPSYFDGSTPFGEAWGTHIYWQEQVFGPWIDGTESLHDYVVVVLDRPIGNLTGWMGSRSYTDAWDGGNYWSHIGYPQDVSGGTRPIFVGGFSMDGDDNTPDSAQALYHQADVIPGQSGGPMFGWWPGEPWPRVVADQSWQNTGSNGASGGSKMVDLVIRARADFP